MILVPNQLPSINVSNYRLAIIGDHPCEADEITRQPFVGTPGRILQAIMSQTGLMKSACFMGNLFQYRPTYGRIDKAVQELPEWNESKSTLQAELRAFAPNAILLLGQETLLAAGIPHQVKDYRGSIFLCNESTSPFFGFKCISSNHPEKIIREYDLLPLLAFDVSRARAEAVSDTFHPTIRTFDVELTASQICGRLDAIIPGQLVSVDIEGGVQQGISCVGVSLDPASAFIVNVMDFGPSEQVRILKSLGRVLSDPLIPKVLQNSLYDSFCLAWKWKMLIRNVRHDTMLSGWELYPELPKGLGTQTSIWTRQPYYKFERKVNDKLTHYRYCCTDAAVTLEIAQKQAEVMTPAQRSHYEFNMQLLPALHYMELRGIKYDVEKAKARLNETTAKMNILQEKIDKLAGGPLNVNSPKQMIKALYTTLSFPPQYVKDPASGGKRLSANTESLLKLVKCPKSEIIYHILHWRAEEAQRKQLEISADSDGRIRCGYNLVGTETGRLTCYESPTGSGTNLQTIMKKNRDLYIADDGMEFFQCDLSGADGWTVAAHCKRLGDDTLMNDYLAKIKPARVLAVMYLAGAQGWEMSKLGVEEMKAAISAATIPEWLYAACKMIQHGSSYQMGKITMSKNILLRSWKDSGSPIYVSPADCEKLQGLYMRGRYKATPRWQDWVNHQLQTTKTLTCASGHVRTFFGRENDQSTLGTALSHEPQANTTYATNLALHRLWHDPDNRDSTGRLIIEPLHQVHDALCGQFPKLLTDWACSKIRSYFTNPITIAEQEIIIPFEGAYGPSWYEQPNTI